MNKSLMAKIKDKEDEMIRLRRHFHRHPEVGWQETKTTSFLASYMKNLGYETEIPDLKGHHTGLFCRYTFGPGPTAVLRFDIDALPVTESSDSEHLPNVLGFASKCSGVSHACGHDGHMAIGLTTATILMEYKTQLSGTVCFLFQPAEEGCRGALPMVEAGYLKDCDYFLAGHIVPRQNYPDLDGDFVCTQGSLATTKLDVTFRGIPAHGAHPEAGKNVMPAAASAILGLYGIPRHSEGASFINVGTCRAGSGRNVVADHAFLELEVRGETTEINTYMVEKARSVLSGAALMQDVQVRTEIVGSAPSLLSSPKMTDLLSKLFQAEETPVRLSSQTTVPFFASEDASHMMEAVKAQHGEATYLLFLSDTTAALHQSNYTFDESVLARAVYVYCRTVLHLLPSA